MPPSEKNKKPPTAAVNLIGSFFFFCFWPFSSPSGENYTTAAAMEQLKLMLNAEMKQPEAVLA